MAPLVEEVQSYDTRPLCANGDGHHLAQDPEERGSAHVSGKVGGESGHSSERPQGSSVGKVEDRFSHEDLAAGSFGEDLGAVGQT